MIGYTETSIRPSTVYTASEMAWRVPAGHCQSCAVKLPADNTAVCARHNADTCERCDRDIVHNG